MLLLDTQATNYRKTAKDKCKTENIEVQSFNNLYSAFTVAGQLDKDQTNSEQRYTINNLTFGVKYSHR